MKLSTVYTAGNALVCVIPKKYAAALRIVKGTQVVISLSNRRMTIERAIIHGEGAMAAGTPSGGASND